MWKVWLISNNNNGSHTGHNLGEFKVQLSPRTSAADEARAAANEMVHNTNNNNRLALDEAAKVHPLRSHTKTRPGEPQRAGE